MSSIPPQGDFTRWATLPHLWIPSHELPRPVRYAGLPRLIRLVRPSCYGALITQKRTDLTTQLPVKTHLNKRPILLSVRPQYIVVAKLMTTIYSGMAFRPQHIVVFSY